MEAKGKLDQVSIDYFSRRVQVTFSFPQSEQLLSSVEALNEKELKVKAVQYRQKRSLDANAYAWTLMSKIAEVVRTDKDFIYEEMLRRYGQPYTDENGVSEKITVLATIDVAKYGIHTKYIGSGHAEGKEFKHYMILKGSSQYNTKEMSVFIDGIVGDCKELGIETLTPRELEQMKVAWKE